MKIIDIKSIENLLNSAGIKAIAKDTIVNCTTTKYIFELQKLTSASAIQKAIASIKFCIHKNVTLSNDQNNDFFTLSLLIDNEERYFPRFMMYSYNLENAKPGSMLFGLDENMKPLIFNIEDTKSLLVAGSSGGGKSVAMNCLIESLALHSKNNVDINLIDLKRCEFSIYKDFKIVKNLCTDYDQAINLLNKINYEIDRIYSIMQAKNIRKATIDDFNINITFIDEYAALSAINQKVVDGLVSRIASIGRAANVYLIIATQIPTNKVISNVIRSNIQSRIGLKTTNAAQSIAILQTRNCCDLLGYGDAYLSIDGISGLIRCQVCNITEDDILSHINPIQDNDEKTKKTKKRRRFLWF